MVCEPVSTGTLQVFLTVVHVERRDVQRPCNSCPVFCSHWLDI